MGSSAHAIKVVAEMAAEAGEQLAERGQAHLVRAGPAAVRRGGALRIGQLPGMDGILGPPDFHLHSW